MSEKNEIKEPVAVGSDSNERLGVKQIVVLPETASENSTIIALGNDGLVYLLTIKQAVAGRKWMRLPAIDEGERA